MIKHIVCFKLKAGESAEKAAEVLKSMKGKVPEIIDMEVGVDFLKSARSYDVILQVLLKDRAALDSYQSDPYHCSVVKEYMHKARESSVAVDYDV
ncbi:MAG: Dabb family protein [Clostridia bacterium]|nr:Dabb family protein [Clostridia bacterium]